MNGPEFPSALRGERVIHSFVGTRDFPIAYWVTALRLVIWDHDTSAPVHRELIVPTRDIRAVEVEKTPWKLPWIRLILWTLYLVFFGIGGFGTLGRISVVYHVPLLLWYALALLAVARIVWLILAGRPRFQCVITTSLGDVRTWHGSSYAFPALREMARAVSQAMAAARQSTQSLSPDAAAVQ